MGGLRPGITAALATVIAVAALGAGAAMADGGEHLPLNPEPGKCYEKVLVPARYETVQEQVVDRPGRTERRVIPAVYGEEVQQELLCAERVETTTVPATYRTFTETVLVRPAGYRTETIPAVYETISEQVLVREAHMEWRRGVLVENRPTAAGYTQVTPTGEVLCYVLIPAEYGVRTRQVLRTPARTVRVAVPAETRTVTRQVIDRPEHVERRVVPAQYRSVRVPVLVSPERIETYQVPPSYRIVTSRRPVGPAGYEWRVIRCADGSDGVLPGYASGPGPYGGSTATDVRVLTSPTLVRAVQAALAGQGYYRGVSDGRATAATERSLSRFQSDRRLAPGWTMETLRALGVPYPN